jgi:hypothetical protein
MTGFGQTNPSGIVSLAEERPTLLGGIWAWVTVNPIRPFARGGR